MKRIILISLATLFLVAAPLSAAENQTVQRQNSSYSGSEYETGGMASERMGPGSGYHGGPGMMGPGSGYHGRGTGMMGRDRGYGMHGGYGQRMNPDSQGWQDMPPEQREQWRQMRSQFMQETLPLRQELIAKQMELETLWDQKTPDTGKIKALSDRIAQLRSKLDQKYDGYLIQSRQEFGDRGWSCPGGGRTGP